MLFSASVIFLMGFPTVGIISLARKPARRGWNQFAEF